MVYSLFEYHLHVKWYVIENEFINLKVVCFQAYPNSAHPQGV